MSYRHPATRHSTAWVLIADRGRARLLATDWPGLDGMTEVADFLCPEGNLSAHETATDSLGRNRAPGGRSYTEEPQTDHRHATARPFARTLVETLEGGRVENRFGHLILAAPPLFLGVLRDCLSAPLLRLVEFDLNEELVQLEVPAIVDRLRRAMPSGAATEA